MIRILLVDIKAFGHRTLGDSKLIDIAHIHPLLEMDRLGVIEGFVGSGDKFLCSDGTAAYRNELVCIFKLPSLRVLEDHHTLLDGSLKQPAEELHRMILGLIFDPERSKVLET